MDESHSPLPPRKERKKRNVTREEILDLLEDVIEQDRKRSPNDEQDKN